VCGQDNPEQTSLWTRKKPFLIEELRVERHLRATTSYNDSLAERVRKREEIQLEFYGSEAMMTMMTLINRSWMNAEQRIRHVVTRYAGHGSHYKLCEKDFHRATENCICMLCGRSCGLLPPWSLWKTNKEPNLL
jgi:hypothetical protein